jgi:hypothetical protein
VIIKVINFLVAKPLNKHLLKEFLKEACPAFRIHSSRRGMLFMCWQSIFMGVAIFLSNKRINFSSVHYHLFTCLKMISR